MKNMQNINKSSFSSSSSVLSLDVADEKAPGAEDTNYFHYTSSAEDIKSIIGIKTPFFGSVVSMKKPSDGAESLDRTPPRSRSLSFAENHSNIDFQDDLEDFADMACVKKRTKSSASTNCSETSGKKTSIAKAIGNILTAPIKWAANTKVGKATIATVKWSARMLAGSMTTAITFPIVLPMVAIVASRLKISENGNKSWKHPIVLAETIWSTAKTSIKFLLGAPLKVYKDPWLDFLFNYPLRGIGILINVTRMYKLT